MTVPANAFVQEVVNGVASKSSQWLEIPMKFLQSSTCVPENVLENTLTVLSVDTPRNPAGGFPHPQMKKQVAILQ